MTWTLALLVLAAAGPTAGPPEPPPPAPKWTEILLRPAPEPRPALKYHLGPERHTLVPGNAALFYHRAIQAEAERRAGIDNRPANAKPRNPNDAVELRISAWGSGPIDQIPLEEARSVLDSFAETLHEVELAAMRRECDWGLFDRDEGIEMRLSEIQSMRTLARLVQLRARVAIREGKPDEALHWIEVEMVMGRHAGDGPTLIQGLVGIALCNIAAACLEQLIQVPGAPNLYWALERRPRPLIDLRPAMDWERQILEREIPELVGIERGPWDRARARRFADVFDTRLLRLVGTDALSKSVVMPLGLPDFDDRLSLATIAARGEDEARRALLAEGFPEAELAKMPVVQVVALDAYRRYAVLRDDFFKQGTIPPWRTVTGSERVHGMTPDQKRANPLLTMFRVLLPAVESARSASVRLERRWDALECIEAIRLDAHAHGGRLPATLDAITEAPTPLDVTTGRPFEYRAEGDTAILSSPAPPGLPDHPAFTIRYVLKLAR